MKKDNRYIKVFINLSLIILGIIVGIAIGRYGKIPFAQEVNLVDVATLMVTVFLAVYVPAVLDRRLQTMRDRKDLLEKRITDYQALLQRINLLVQDDRKLSVDGRLTIYNLLDISGHRLDTLIILINNSNLGIALDSNIEIIKKLDNEHRDLLSDGKKAKEDYSDDIRDREEILYNKLDEMTSLLIFKISEAK